MRNAAADVARRVFSAWSAAVADDYWAAEIEWRDGPSVPDAGVFRGRDEALETGRDRVLVI